MIASTIFHAAVSHAMRGTTPFIALLIAVVVGLWIVAASIHRH